MERGSRSFEKGFMLTLEADMYVVKGLISDEVEIACYSPNN